MKKLLACILAFISIVTCITNHSFAKTSSSLQSRVINIVYDDSGSMIENGKGKKVDTWCQAKYSMEVFASMLSEKDTMNIYVMSDYDGGKTTSQPKLILKGKDGAKKNVSKVHGMITKASNTPFDSVRKAYSDLVKTKADEKWLVVLTDGEFQPKETDVDGFFARKSEEIQVMFLSMGKEGAIIREDVDHNVYFEKAKTNDEILEKITGICTRVFNSNKLELDADHNFAFDVPMSELIVFAQGSNVEIKGIKNSKGKAIKGMSLPVSVKYSTKATTNASPEYQNPKIARSLKGSIAVFEGDYSAGNYTVDVTGAKTVEIYYKPNIDIAMYLENASGKEVTNMDNLEAGNYKIKFGFVKSRTHEKVATSKLLGNITYKAIITNNGKKSNKVYSNGDQIKLEVGELKIDAYATFLDYNTVSTELEYQVYKNQHISYRVVDNPEYIVTADGLTTAIKGGKYTTNIAPTKVKVQFNGKDISEKEWKQSDIPKVKMIQSKLDLKSTFLNPTSKVDNLRIEKSDEIGVYYVYPILEKNLKAVTYIGTDFKISLNQKVGAASWSGESIGTLNVTDQRNWISKHKNVIVKLIVLGFILFVIMGYTPIFKKRLPKSIKKSPMIECHPIGFGKKKVVHGRFSKDFWSVVIPYRNEKGTLRFVPLGVSAPSMKIKASGGGGYVVTNTKSYAGKSYITFDGIPVAKGETKLMRKSANVMINVKTETMKYTCLPRV